MKLYYSLALQLWCIAIPFCSNAQDRQTHNHLIDTIRIQHSKPIEPVVKYRHQNTYTGGTLADVISHTAGIDMVQSGANTAKPIIEGLRNSRIVILADGVKLLGQDWSDQHTTEIDMSVFQSVNIVKGARSVQYGAGALGGVIRLEPQPLSYTKKLGGHMGVSGSSNDGRTVLNALVHGNILGKWAWQAQQTYHTSGDYKTARYYVNNTGVRQYNTALSAGYKGEYFQTKISWSRYVAENGIFYGSLTGNIDELADRVLLGQPTETLPFSYKIRSPRQQVQHSILKYYGQLRLDNENKIELNYHFQQNKRKEFEIRRLDRSSIPTQNLELSSHFLEGSWHYHKNHIHTTLGGQYLYQNNYNQPGTGVAPTIPNYKLYNYGAYMIAEYQTVKWRAALGVRYDYSKSNALGYNWLGNLYGGYKKFSNFSYSLTGRYQITPKWQYIADIGMAWRSPDPYELYVNGKQHGLPIYYTGNEDLQSERGLKFSNKVEYHSQKLNLGFSAFIQPIRNYIYTQPRKQYRYLFSGPAYLFHTVQTDAFFRGADATLIWKPIVSITYEANAAITLANDAKTKGYLPMIPPLSTYQELSLHIPNKVFTKFYVALNHRYHAKQTRYDAAQDLTETPPSAYHLLGARVEAELPYYKNKTCIFMIKIDNLTNQLYKNYTDHFRYFVHGKGLDIQFKTIFNF